MKKIAILSAVAGLTILAAAAAQAQAGGALAALQGYAATPAPNAPAAKAEVAGGFTKGYVACADPADGVPIKPVEWVTISGGKFNMGTDSGQKGFEDIKSPHEVTIKTFYMAKTDVTIEQYAECIIKGRCTEPGTGEYCNWGKPGRQFHPVNCVDWDQAQAYAKFKDARLPSEAEWEYAATSSGRKQKYTWGNEEPTCDRAVMYGNGGYGCGANGTMPVCSKPAGNTAHGLCDMAGNVWQWVQDKYQESYAGAPVDGGAFEGTGSYRVVRGGAFFNGDAEILRAAYRGRNDPGGRYSFIGFRVVKLK
ncbi:MAG TPA: hypothetical protein DCZ93_02790 [Elusimicrobia bacterium]|nr:hypothetical protein [Elusimicrobiota bacterium]